MAMLAGCGGRTALTETPGDGRGEEAGAGGQAMGGAGVTDGSSGVGGAGPTGGSSGAGAQGGSAGSGLAGNAADSAVSPSWRMSVVPFCGASSALGSHETVDVWSDASGVFLIVDATIYANRGSGWSTFAKSARAGFGGLSGIRGGPLIRYGGVTDRCGIEFLDANAAVSCSGAIEPTDLFAVTGNLAYAAYSDRVLIFDGVFWVQRGLPLAAPASVVANQVWASATSLAVSTSAGVYLANGSGALARQTGLPDSALGYMGLGGSAGNDLWAGSLEGRLFHFDGSTWSLAFTVTSAEECRGIRRIWGDGGSVFVATENALLRRNGGAFDTILELPCSPDTRVWAVWGNSATEVFVATESGDSAEPCGDVTVSWFDGARLRPL